LITDIEANLQKVMKEKNPKEKMSAQTKLDTLMNQLVGSDFQTMGIFAQFKSLASSTQNDEQLARYISTYIDQAWDRVQQKILRTPSSIQECEEMLLVADMMRIFGTAYASTNPETNNIYAQKRFDKALEKRIDFFAQAQDILDMVLK
jgi:hypothetical protein